ncbi:MAG: hypothetical protein ACHQ7M_16060, partial [Chloroflexota bacterium]
MAALDSTFARYSVMVENWSGESRYALPTEQEARLVPGDRRSTGRGTAMVPTALVAPNISGGARLLHILPQFGLSVVDAFWYQSPSLGRWRLLLSLIEWDRLGSLASYEALQHALATVPE